MSKQLKWNKFHFLWWQTIWENYSRGLTSPDSVSEKITQQEQSPLIMRQVVWRNYSEQMTEKQNSVKTCTKSPKQETPPIYWNRCRFDQKRISCQYKAGMNRWKSYKSSNSLLWKFSLQKTSLAAATRFLQLPTYRTAGEISQHYLPTIRFQYSTFVEIE